MPELLKVVCVLNLAYIGLHCALISIAYPEVPRSVSLSNASLLLWPVLVVVLVVFRITLLRTIALIAGWSSAVFAGVIVILLLIWYGFVAILGIPVTLLMGGATGISVGATSLIVWFTLFGLSTPDAKLYFAPSDSRMAELNRKLFWGGLATTLGIGFGLAGCSTFGVLRPHLVAPTDDIGLFASAKGRAKFSATGPEAREISNWIETHQGDWSSGDPPFGSVGTNISSNTYNLMLNGDTIFLTYAESKDDDADGWPRIKRSLSEKDRGFWGALVARIEKGFTTEAAYELKAAEAGSAKAQYIVGNEYLRGIDGCSKDFAKAEVWLERSVAQNNPDAIETLANALRDGVGSRRDDERACSLYERAIALGRNIARAELAWMVENGRGTAKDPARARELYRKAAEGGYAWAWSALGRQYRDAVGVPQDFAKALAYFRRGAEFQDATSMNALGWLYHEGNGVAPDDAMAFKWFDKAALVGDAASQNTAGWYLLNGIGVKRDPVQASIHFEVAAKNGNEAAMHNLVALYKAGAQGVPRDPERARKWQAENDRLHRPAATGAN